MTGNLYATHGTVETGLLAGSPIASNIVPALFRVLHRTKGIDTWIRRVPTRFWNFPQWKSCVRGLLIGAPRFAPAYWTSYALHTDPGIMSGVRRCRPIMGGGL